MKKNNYLRIAFLFTVFFPLSLVSSAQDGSLDLTFDTDGIVTTPIGTSYASAYSVAIQMDGKILVAGSSYNGSNDDFAVARYNIDGSLDTNFGIGGIVNTDISGSADQGRSIAIQSDGKILMAGYGFVSSYDFAVVRYNTDGSLDNTFDTDGIVTTSIDTSIDQAYSITIQPDGKILVAGFSKVGPSYYFAVIRYNVNGSLDNTFDTDGIVTTSIGLYGFASVVTLQNDGKILVAGSSSSGSNYDFALVRYNTNGDLDNTFDMDGIVITPIGADYEKVNSVVVQNDGKIVAGGSSSNGSNDDFALARYNVNGVLDNTFDIDGIAITPIGTDNEGVRCLYLQTDGKILAVGYSNNGSNDDVALARYNVNGVLDNTFDIDGIVITPIGTGNEVVNSVALQNDGKIVTAGSSYNGSNNDFAVVRYNNCDLITSITLPLDELTIIADQAGATYQWIDCNTNTAIPGQTNQSYTVTVNGNYAVVVTLGACSDTSECIIVNPNMGISSPLTQDIISIYPNPLSNQSILQASYSLNNATLIIYNSMGEEVKRIHDINKDNVIISRDQLPNGVYFICLTQINKAIVTEKLIVID